MKKYDDATEERIQATENALWNDWSDNDWHDDSPKEEFIRKKAIEILGLEPLIDDKVYFEKQAIAKLLVAIMSESTSSTRKKSGGEADFAKGKITEEADWNKRCDEVKAANGGDYPEQWHSAIIESGLMDLMLKKWQ